MSNHTVKTKDTAAQKLGAAQCRPLKTTIKEMPKNGTPILAYCINRHIKGWMVIAYNGLYWQTIPGKYGVGRITRWSHLPPPEPDDCPMLVNLPSAASRPQDGQ